MDDRFEKCLRDVVIEKVEQHEIEDSDVLWSSIENSIIEQKAMQKETEKKRIRFSLIQKVSVSGIALLLIILIGISSQGDIKAFGTIFQSYFIKFLSSSQENTGVLVPGDNHTQDEETALNPDDIQAFDTLNLQGYVDITLEKLLEIYPYSLYIPANVLFADLSIIQYKTISDEHWIVLFNYKGGGLEFSLRQERAPEFSSVVGYENEDTEAYFVYENGVEYLIRQDLDNFIRVNWFQGGAKFILYGYLTPDQAMAVSRSLIEDKK